jgi:Uma2 family endonuclease
MAEPAYRRSLPDRGDGRTWPAQGEWTYDDYARLPDDGNRYEVIRGFLYVTPAPNYKHQFVVVKLIRSFDQFVSERELGVVLSAPFDILLPLGAASPVEPDLVFFRTGNTPEWGDRHFAGVPDLVVEVLSPSTRSRDRRTKLRAYQEAGVPEYWLVDPDLRTVLVYALQPGRGYIERCRGGVGERMTSSVLPGFELEVAGLFPRQG